MSRNTAKTADTAETSSSSHEYVNCPFHGIKASLLCKEDDCHRNICEICLIRDHSYHDVIAPENGFVYCRDPDIVDSVEKDMVKMLCDQVMGLSITAGKGESEMSPGTGNQQPEEEVTEIVYDRKMDQKNHLETEHQPVDISLVKGGFLHFFPLLRCTKLKRQLKQKKSLVDKFHTPLQLCLFSVECYL